MTSGQKVPIPQTILGLKCRIDAQHCNTRPLPFLILKRRTFIKAQAIPVLVNLIPCHGCLGARPETQNPNPDLKSRGRGSLAESGGVNTDRSLGARASSGATRAYHPLPT